jgi:hypothetical protein
MTDQAHRDPNQQVNDLDDQQLKAAAGGGTFDQAKNKIDQSKNEMDEAFKDFDEKFKGFDKTFS